MIKLDYQNSRLINYTYIGMGIFHYFTYPCVNKAICKNGMFINGGL